MNIISRTIFIRCSLILAIFSQSIVYDSGLSYMRKIRQVCICNHHSKIEIHRNVKSLSKSDCHDYKKTIHVCSCKKHKNPNELSNLLKQTFFLASNQAFLSIQFTSYFFSLSNHIADFEGYHLTLIKPPRLS